MNEYKEFKAKTVDEAVSNAMMELGVPSDRLDYSVIDHGKSGFLGIGSRPAVIKARALPDKELESLISDTPVKEEKKKDSNRKNNHPDKKKDVQKAEAPKKENQPKKDKKKDAPKKEQPQKQEKPVEAAPVKVEEEKKPEKEIIPVDVTPYLAPAKEFLDDVFKAMKIDAEIVVEPDEEVNTINVTLKGEDMGVLIGKRGQTLDSLQYLTSIVINKGQNKYIRVKVDTENYRCRRKETLENLARNIAVKVRNTNKTVALEPMNPYERRIIHSALQKDKYVDTHSEGEEPYRKVVVTPNKNCKEYSNRRKNYGGKGRYNNRNRRGGNNRRDHKPSENKGE